MDTYLPLLRSVNTILFYLHKPVIGIIYSLALVEVLKLLVDLVKVWPHVGHLTPALFHDLDVGWGRRLLRHRRTAQRGRLLDLPYNFCKGNRGL